MSIALTGLPATDENKEAIKAENAKYVVEGHKEFDGRKVKKYQQIYSPDMKPMSRIEYPVWR